MLTRTNFGFLVKVIRLEQERHPTGRGEHGLGRHRRLHAVGIWRHDRGIRSRRLLEYRRVGDVDGFDFRALAAIIVGGTSVFGGRGSVMRTLLGVVFVSVLTNIMVLSGLGFGYQQMAIGALIVAAVSIDALARKAASI